MTPFQAGKVSIALWILNALLSIVVILLVIKFTIILFSKKPQIGEFVFIKNESRKTDQLAFGLNELRACWEVQFQPKPPALKAAKEVKPEQKKELNSSQVHFKLIACSPHSDPEKSCAFLLDEQNKKQILVCMGMNVGQTEYRVVKIAKASVELESKDSIITLERPQLSLYMFSSAKDKQEKSQSTFKSQDVIEDDQRITILNATPFSKYGLNEQDQIIAVGDERIYKIKELKNLAATNNNTQTRLTVLRNGRLIFLDVSSDFFSCLR